MKQNLTYVSKWMSGCSLPEQILIHSSIIFVGFKTWKLMSHPNCDIHKIKVVSKCQINNNNRTIYLLKQVDDHPEKNNN